MTSKPHTLLSCFSCGHCVCLLSGDSTEAVHQSLGASLCSLRHRTRVVSLALEVCPSCWAELGHQDDGWARDSAWWESFPRATSVWRREQNTGRLTSGVSHHSNAQDARTSLLRCLGSRCEAEMLSSLCLKCEACESGSPPGYLCLLCSFSKLLMSSTLLFFKTYFSY